MHLLRALRRGLPVARGGRRRKKVLVFPQLCHGCGSCTLACPEGAIAEIPNPIGVIESGPARDDIAFAQGVLNIGEPMAVPIISQLKAQGTHQLTIIDASPGTACPVVEPTAAGIHDMERVLATTEHFGVPALLMHTKADLYPEDTAEIEAHCEQKGPPLVGQLPFDTVSPSSSCTLTSRWTFICLSTTWTRPPC